MSEMSHDGMTEKSYYGMHAPAAARRSLHLIMPILIDLQNAAVYIRLSYSP